MTSTPLYLYVDIETAPSHDIALVGELYEKHLPPDLDLSGIIAAANLKDPEKIAEDIEKRKAKARVEHDVAIKKAGDDFEEAYRKTCLDATTGHIACVSFAFGDDDVDHVENDAFDLYAKAMETDLVPLEDVRACEFRMLQTLFNMLTNRIEELAIGQALARWNDTNAHRRESLTATEAAIEKADYLDKWMPTIRCTFVPIVVAHHAQFDIRYLWQRAIILGVRVPDWWPHDAKPWENERVWDTMVAWAGQGNRIGLDRLCRALGIPGKKGMNGSIVWDAIREGRIDDVVEYCDDDVERLRSVHRRIRQQPVREVTTVETWSNAGGRAEVLSSVAVEGGAA